MSHCALLSTEKTIIAERLSRCGHFPVEVTQFQPAPIPNPLSEARVGRFRALDSRMCLTADMAVIREYFLTKKTDPPSFLEAGPRQLLYSDPRAVRYGIVTPGGIAPGLNTVIHSIVRMHEIYDADHAGINLLGGFRGLATGDTMDLCSEVTKASIHRGGTLLGTSRRESPRRSWLTRSWHWASTPSPSWAVTVR